MADFIRADLRGSRFERVDLSGAEFRSVDLARARFRSVDLHGVVMRGVEIVDSEIYGEIENLTINGVDIGPLVNAELDTRSPDRAKMRPTDPDGFREAWDVGERLGRDCRTGPSPGSCVAARVVRRRVVAHRDAAAPRVRHRLLDQAGDSRSSVAVGSPGPAVGRDV